MSLGMRIRAIIDSKRTLTLWTLLLAISVLASLFVVNPSLHPQGRALSWPQLQLQLAYTPQRAMAVLAAWGPGAVDRYLSVIWIDLLFALSYGPALSLYIRRMGGSLTLCVLPLAEMLANLTETTLEMIWVAHHSAAEPMFALFLTHSVIATVKFMIVPLYLVQLPLLLLYWLRSQAMEVAFRRPVEARKTPRNRSSLAVSDLPNATPSEKYLLSSTQVQEGEP